MNRQKTICCGITLLAMAGCDVAPKALPASQAPMPPSTQPLVLRAGDKIELKFYYAPELNDNQQIRPDGKITLQLVGDIQAAGKTTSQLSDDLRDAYGSQLKYPQCAVIIRASYQSRVYVGGEVQRPGLLELPGNMSVLDAIMASGGFQTTTAEPSSVIVIRHGDGNQRLAYKVNLKDALLGGPHADFALQPEDIVYVPRTQIVNVDNFIEQYINSVIPQTGFIYTTPAGEGTIGIDTSTR